MREVKLEDAEENFADLIAQAEAGESMTILRADKPVARIVPVPSPQREVFTEEERRVARKELREIMERGYDLGIVWNGRDELYNRD